jgi:hypothetical protein|tara:strand:- start:514 stop:819 length:306 start_codon:yes stop_codon:yes gene_type:complete
MKVIDPSITTHEIVTIPRFYPSLALTMELYNEADNVRTTPTPTYRILDGKLYLSFTYTFLDKQRFQIKVLEGTKVVYRNKIWVTAQTPQDFKLTSGVYVYE